MPTKSFKGKSCNEHGKRKCHGSGALSELFENPIHPLQIHMVPPFVDENSLTFHLQIHGEDVYRSREISGNLATVSSECQATWLPVRGDGIGHAIADKHSATLAKDPSHGGRKKEEKIRTETWIKLSIKPEEINFSQSIIFLCPLFSGSELKYLSSIANTELNCPPIWLNYFWGSLIVKATT